VRLLSRATITGDDLQMCKNPLRSEQNMSDATVTTEADAVSRAAVWAEKLLSRVHHGPGDNVETAMHRAEQKYGVPAQTFWALRYRRPKAMAVAAWLHLKNVYEAECGRQEARLRHELEITKTLPATPARLALIAEAEAALGQAAGSEAAAKKAARSTG
jgi:hypothetical protein